VDIKFANLERERRSRISGNGKPEGEQPPRGWFRRVGEEVRVLRWPVCIGIVLLALTWMIDRYDILHDHAAPFSQVEVSRFILGRWPRDWKEVTEASYAYYGSDTIGKNHFSRVQISPASGDSCIVTFRFRNLLGIDYEESKKLVWTPKIARAVAENEHHTSVASFVAEWYSEWVRDENGGKLSADMSGIAEYIARPRFEVCFLCSIHGLSPRTVRLRCSCCQSLMGVFHSQ